MHPEEPEALRLLAPQRSLSKFFKAIHTHSMSMSTITFWHPIAGFGTTAIQ
jgi:hypothetical protein